MKPDDNQKICGHCGTVEKALTIWPQTIHHTCPCKCHEAYLYDNQRLLSSKSKKRKK